MSRDLSWCESLKTRAFRDWLWMSKWTFSSMTDWKRRFYTLVTLISGPYSATLNYGTTQNKWKSITWVRGCKSRCYHFGVARTGIQMRCEQRDKWSSQWTPLKTQVLLHFVFHSGSTTNCFKTAKLENCTITIYIKHNRRVLKLLDTIQELN
jgi:hypothetical protein